MADTHPAKLHAACDECRTRKLKCSGDAPACSRCDREKLTCVYSPQKPMGRPRKRRREQIVIDDAPDSQHDSRPSVDPFTMPLRDDSRLPLHTHFTADFPAPGLVRTNENVSCQLESSLHVSSLPSLPPSYEPNMDLLDPLLWEHPSDGSGSNSQANSTPGQTDTGPCCCLSLSYLALTDLQSINDFAFPAVVPRIRPALVTASAMMHCAKCPMDPFTAIQNIQSLNSLLSATAERFHKVLTGIDDEATRLEQKQEKKAFRIGDNAPENRHLHTGTLDCPMGYNLDLGPQDWKRLAKQMLKTEVVGGGHNPLTLLGLIEDMEQRQHKWHNDASMHTDARTKLFGAENMCTSEDEALCLKMIRHVRTMVEHMDWD